MKRISLTLSLIAFIMAPCTTAAQTRVKNNNLRLHTFIALEKLHLMNSAAEEPLPFSGKPEQQQKKSGKSPLRAALISGLIPGAGQWYSGNKLRALAFAAAEISLWFGHSHYNGRGDDMVRDFRAYADRNWNEPDYKTWAGGVDISKYSHTLPDSKTQQYYEMIGKYNQFLAGWPDSSGDPDESEMRLQYMSSQHKSNKMYKRASRTAQLLIINHVLSAAEAAFSMHRRNAQFSAHLRFRQSPSKSRLIPVAQVTYKW